MKITGFCILKTLWFGKENSSAGCKKLYRLFLGTEWIKLIKNFCQGILLIIKLRLNFSIAIFMSRISSFPPIVSKDSQILILGSVPGVKSLEMQEYYAHPQNKFWKILFELFETEFTIDYSKKLKFLEKNKIAVWDVIDSCERKGSLDTEIRNENHHNILHLLEEFPGIKAIFCNGQKSFKTLTKILPQDLQIPIFVLPSTSPAYTISFEKKSADWSALKNYL